jgi:hypothetical protein
MEAKIEDAIQSEQKRRGALFTPQEQQELVDDISRAYPPTAGTKPYVPTPYVPIPNEHDLAPHCANAHWAYQGQMLELYMADKEPEHYARTIQIYNDYLQILRLGFKIRNLTRQQPADWWYRPPAHLSEFGELDYTIVSFSATFDKLEHHLAGWADGDPTIYRGLPGWKTTMDSFLWCVQTELYIRGYLY